MKNKFILDACCGPRMMWFDKQHPNTIFMDIREEEKGFIDNRPNREIKPDLVGDFRDLPGTIKNKKFKLIVWDPPHLLGKNYGSRITKTYGILLADSWRADFKKGFEELWNVLDDNGTLIFKFNDYHIPFQKVLELFPVKPLFGNTVNTKKRKSSKWFCFMKIPK